MNIYSRKQRWKWLLFAGVLVIANARELFAQDEDDFYPFNTEYQQIILSAAKGKTKSLTIYKDKRYSRGTTKVKITFLNDSVFVRKSGLHKSTYVIRYGVFVLYNPKAKHRAETSELNGVDSAGCKVYWDAGDAVTIASYCRYMYDSLGREIDYYFTYWRTYHHNVTRYEGDTVTIKEYWSNDPFRDTMHLYLTTYCYESYNSDSTFFICRIRHSPQWENSRYANKPHASDTRKYITYDDQHRIVGVKREEVGFYTDGDQSVALSNLRVTYR